MAPIPALSVNVPANKKAIKFLSTVIMTPATEKKEKVPITTGK